MSIFSVFIRLCRTMHFPCSTKVSRICSQRSDGGSQHGQGSACFLWVPMGSYVRTGDKRDPLPGLDGHLLSCLQIKHTCTLIHSFIDQYQTAGPCLERFPPLLPRMCFLMIDNCFRLPSYSRLFSLHCRFLSLFLQKVMFILICVVTLLVILGIILATALS